MQIIYICYILRKTNARFQAGVKALAPLFVLRSFCSAFFACSLKPLPRSCTAMTLPAGIGGFFLIGSSICWLSGPPFWVSKSLVKYSRSSRLSLRTGPRPGSRGHSNKTCLAVSGPVLQPHWSDSAEAPHTNSVDLKDLLCYLYCDV